MFINNQSLKESVSIVRVKRAFKGSYAITQFHAPFTGSELSFLDARGPSDVVPDINRGRYRVRLTLNNGDCLDILVWWLPGFSTSTMRLETHHDSEYPAAASAFYLQQLVDSIK